MTRMSRAFGELLALGVANGLLLGAGLAAADRVHALVVATGAGTFISLTYLVVTRFRRC
jgi:threonine/homoserine/homoserine lactone efflux protein